VISAEENYLIEVQFATSVYGVPRDGLQHQPAPNDPSGVARQRLKGRSEAARNTRLDEARHGLRRPDLHDRVFAFWP
jgi:hypothetical protein